MGKFLSWAAFILIVLPGMAIPAAVYLLPTYRGMVVAEHERDCVHARTQAFQDFLTRNDEFIRTLPEDELHTRRLIIMQNRLAMENEVVVEDPNLPPAIPPGMVSLPEPRMPSAPDNQFLALAGRLDDVRTRRGLLLLWGLTMVAAMLVFTPSGSRKADLAAEEAAAEARELGQAEAQSP